MRGGDDRAALFFEFARLKAECNPKYWLLENVKMKKQDQDIISAFMGCEPVEIDSNLFSAQNRKRLYWTNIPIAPIFDAKIDFWQVREWQGEHLKEYKLNKTPSRIRMWNEGKGNGRMSEGSCINISHAKKTRTLTRDQDRAPNAGLIEFEDFARYLTALECERLQTLPDNYTASMKSRKKRWAAIGNGWTVDVIAHILRGINDYAP